MGKLKKILFIVSIIANLCFLLTWINQLLSRYGVLISDITVPLTEDVKIRLPKGLVVRDATPKGIVSIKQAGEVKNKFSRLHCGF